MGCNAQHGFIVLMYVAIADLHQFPASQNIDTAVKDSWTTCVSRHCNDAVTVQWAVL